MEDTKVTIQTPEQEKVDGKARIVEMQKGSAPFVEIADSKAPAVDTTRRTLTIEGTKREDSTATHKGFQFNRKKSPFQALIATDLGVIGLISVIVMIELSFRQGGTATLQSGAVILVCLIMSIVGLVFAVKSKQEEDRSYVFSYIGMTLNAVVFLGCAAMLVLGL